MNNTIKSLYRDVFDYHIKLIMCRDERWVLTYHDFDNEPIATELGIASYDYLLDRYGLFK